MTASMQKPTEKTMQNQYIQKLWIITLLYMHY